MQALQGQSSRKELAKKKLKFKELQGLSEGDTSPSEFDPADSDLESSENDDESD